MSQTRHSIEWFHSSEKGVFKQVVKISKIYSMKYWAFVSALDLQYHRLKAMPGWSDVSGSLERNAIPSSVDKAPKVLCFKN